MYRRSNSPNGTASYCAKFHACAVKPGARLDPATVKTGYADMAIES
jgi:hypothetical protein